MKKLSIKALEEKLSQLEELSDEQRKALEDDDRKGVHNLLKRWDQRQLKKRQMISRYKEMMRFENQLYEKGCQYIAGIDEAGRGPLAGPVVAAAVILKPKTALYGINDSKQLSKKKRQEFAAKIYEQAVSVGIGIVSAREIDSINIYQAAKLAMRKAVDSLNIVPDYLLIDAMTLPTNVPQSSIVKGDERSISIAAASIIAKEERDRIMAELDHIYPGYHFASHAGYGTKQHLAAIEALGPCPEHRLSFAPLQSK
ncbi:ribonuclease HII [Scopulibacillus daqui]|uniref:Ribonuclease HII n=1 Tax=Scopulibacillus daqui TaxID=1469162 RepID=A0ABS2PWA4_9BACL|nr:ribonuclease HII [Scopulibacillus daqui]